MLRLSTAELVSRILVAGILGGLVGLDRELSDQPAGLRTHVLVSMGAALFTMAGAYGFLLVSDDAGREFDPTRVAAQIVTGIGFLGAGAIIRQGASVRGLTTAAGLWVTAAIGMAVGFGQWAAALATTVAAVFALFGMKRVERRLLYRLKPGRFEYILDARDEFSIADATRSLEAQGCRIDAVSMDSGNQDQHHLVIQVRLPPRRTPDEIADELRGVHGVVKVAWSR